MSKEEILLFNLKDSTGGDLSAIYKSMEQYAQQEAVAFFIWCFDKTNGYVDYIRTVKPFVISNEIEDNLAEFESATVEERYELYLKSKNNI